MNITITKEILHILHYSRYLAHITKSSLVYPIHIFTALLIKTPSILLTLQVDKNFIIHSLETFLDLNYTTKFQQQINYYWQILPYFSFSVIKLFILNKNYFNSFDLLDNIIKLNDYQINSFLKLTSISKNSLIIDYNISKFTNNNNKLTSIGTKIIKSSNLINIKTNEIKYFNQVLYRKYKNSILFVGDSGVGKKSIISLLSESLGLNHTLPLEIWKLDPRIFHVDTIGIEKKFIELFKLLEKIKNVVLFIENIDTFIGTNVNNVVNDSIINIFKLYLNISNIRIIGTISPLNFKTSLEKNINILEYFEVINVKEPEYKECLDIINRKSIELEQYHNIIIPNNILTKSLDLSKKYLLDKALPGKVINLIDSSSSLAKGDFISNLYKDNNVDLSKTLYDLQSKIRYFYNIKEYDKLKALQTEELILIQKLSKKNKYNYLNKNIILKEKHLLTILSLWTKIPIQDFSKTNENKLLFLENNLQKQVIGQQKAVSIISDSVRRSKLGFKDTNKPIGSFFFAGPTGVGKTELAKALAYNLFGSENALIRFDMSEFMEAHSTSRLIGSPPGYVGYGEGGQLTQAVKKQPYSIILFDEIEKAHPEVSNIMLQLLDDGRLTDTSGDQINFTNTIIIFTSNLGYPKNINNYNTHDKEIYTKISKQVQQALEKYFKPEFINRIDNIIVFNNLQLSDLLLILNKYIDKLKIKINNLAKPVILHIDELAKNIIVKAGYQPGYGARPLSRALSRMVEIPLTNLLFNYKLNKTLYVSFSGNYDTLLLNVKSLN
uniref:Clp protease ATP binding subunit n=1 Tax=Piridium sociabile TaxID=2570542 RepID=A0A5B9XUX6_9ALVE|nr:Clp protease ATP binding subunit [Piridium sociabile]